MTMSMVFQVLKTLEKNQTTQTTFGFLSMTRLLVTQDHMRLVNQNLKSASTLFGILAFNLTSPDADTVRFSRYSIYSTVLTYRGGVQVQSGKVKSLHTMSRKKLWRFIICGAAFGLKMVGDPPLKGWDFLKWRP